MNSRPMWCILTPVYQPAPGGGAVYSASLARALTDEGIDVLVVTEDFPGEDRFRREVRGPGSITIDRVFNFRAGRVNRDWRSYGAYVAQNAHMLGLASRVAEEARKKEATSLTFLIHSSWFYKASLLPWVLPGLRQVLPGRTRLVIDVRDPRFGHWLAPILRRFDAAVACSEDIAAALQPLLPPRVQLAVIPVPFERPDPPSRAEIEQAKAKCGLAGVRYLLNPNGVSEPKGHPALVETTRAFRALAGYEGTVLATIGRSRDWTANDERARAEGILRYGGAVPHRTALALMAGALATVIINRVEGMPRSGLESLCLGTPLVGPDIAEFRRFIPSSVVASEEPHAIASQLRKLIESPPAERYPLELHDPAGLVSSYRALEWGEQSAGATA